MTSTSLRTLFGLTLALLGFAKANAQAQINIDWSNLSAVTFSGTGSNALVNQTGSNLDTIILVGFFSHDTDSNVGFGDFANPATLGDHNQQGTYNLLQVFDQITSASYVDLLINSSADEATVDFSTSAAAFTGASVWDLSSATFTHGAVANYLPALGASGNILFRDQVIGTWTVTGQGSAVPEPSVYALLFGCSALGFIIWRRKHALSAVRSRVL
ncbi:MAG: PEP-CTERM sorting domain-containing protein [Candidatus Didemnitutus sp.]|nr:PEP-CTERM sorting domain-containing protein [Candidatus Didemnitutus sp.]